MVTRISALLLGLATLIGPLRGAAQPAAAATDVSERDVASTRSAAQEAIEDGTHTPLELSALYMEVAVAAAHLGEGEAARAAFTAALAMNPDARLSPDLPTVVRSPFMEAKGFWSGHATRLAVDIEPSDRGDGLFLSIVDPANLSARVRVLTRRASEPHFREAVFAPKNPVRVAVSGAISEPIQVLVSLLDEYGNRIWQAGSEGQPLELSRVAARESPRSAEPPQPVPERRPVFASNHEVSSTKRTTPIADRSARPYRWLSGLSFATSGAALSGAVWAHLQREKLAHDWNKGACDGSGFTRGTVCAKERERLSEMDRLALGLYAGGGALLLTGVVLLIVSPSSDRDRGLSASARRSWFCANGPGQIGASCAARF